MSPFIAVQACQPELEADMATFRLNLQDIYHFHFVGSFLPAQFRIQPYFTHVFLQCSVQS